MIIDEIMVVQKQYMQKHVRIRTFRITCTVPLATGTKFNYCGLEKLAYRCVLVSDMAGDDQKCVIYLIKIQIKIRISP